MKLTKCHVKIESCGRNRYKLNLRAILYFVHGVVHRVAFGQFGQKSVDKIKCCIKTVMSVISLIKKIMDRSLIVHFIKRTVSFCPWTSVVCIVHGRYRRVHAVHSAKYLLSMDDLCYLILVSILMGSNHDKI